MFLAKNERFAQKTEEQIPNPVLSIKLIETMLYHKVWFQLEGNMDK